MPPPPPPPSQLPLSRSATPRAGAPAVRGPPTKPAGTRNAPARCLLAGPFRSVGGPAPNGTPPGPPRPWRTLGTGSVALVKQERFSAVVFFSFRSSLPGRPSAAAPARAFLARSSSDPAPPASRWTQACSNSNRPAIQGQRCGEPRRSWCHERDPTVPAPSAHRLGPLQRLLDVYGGTPGNPARGATKSRNRIPRRPRRRPFALSPREGESVPVPPRGSQAHPEEIRS